jgi:hypothetical protein
VPRLIHLTGPLLVVLAGCGGGDVPSGPSFDQSGQDAVCGKVAERLAPGMTYGAGTDLVNAPLTASQMSALLARQGDAKSAAYWRKQRSETLVYTCTFSGPVPSATAEPGPCPPGQIPVADGSGPQRTFLVDAAGHATEEHLPFPIPEETCG